MNTRYNARFAPGSVLREEDAKSLLPFGPVEGTWQGVLAKGLPDEIRAGTARAVITCVIKGNLSVSIQRKLMEPVEITYEGCFPEAEQRSPDSEANMKSSSKQSNRWKVPGFSSSPKR